MHDDKPSSSERDAIQTRPSLPDPIVCRGKTINSPHAVQCLVDWPIYCMSAVKIGGQCFCGHKDRLQFAARAKAGAKSGKEKNSCSRSVRLINRDQGNFPSGPAFPYLHLLTPVSESLGGCCDPPRLEFQSWVSVGGETMRHKETMT